MLTRYYVPDTILSTLHLLSHFIFITSLWGGTVIILFYAWRNRLSNLTKVTQPVSDEVGIWTLAPECVFSTNRLYCLF